MSPHLSEKSGKIPLIIRRRSRAVLDEMLISWDEGGNECGTDHEDCVYNRAYPNAVVRLRDLGLLKPEEFCPNKAEKSLEYLAKQEAERSEKAEVRTGWPVRFFPRFC